MRKNEYIYTMNDRNSESLVDLLSERGEALTARLRGMGGDMVLALFLSASSFFRNTSDSFFS